MITSRSSVVAKLLAAVVAVPAMFAACGGDPVIGPTGGSGGTGGSTTSTGGTGGTGGGTGGSTPATLTAERWGARLFGPILAISRTDRTLWFGTRPVLDADVTSGVVRGGLGRLDLDTGDVKIIEAELPQVDQDFDGNTVKGPVPTAGVVQDGTKRLVVARTGILVIDGDTVTEKKIALPGGNTNASPTGIVVDRGGGRTLIWAATDAGLVRMNADTFAVEQVFGMAELGSTNIGSLTLDPQTGAIYLAVYEDNGPGSQVARVEGTDIKTFTPGANGTPTGLVGDVVWSTKAGAAVIAVGTWDTMNAGGIITWDGSAATTLATDAQLGTAARGNPDKFGAVHLAVDDTDGLVIVGGGIRGTPPFGYLAGGGLAWIDLTTKNIAGLSTTTSLLPGDEISAVSYDPKTRRTYVALRQPCNEHQLGVLGLVAVSFRADGTARFERPVLSGVRSMAVVGDEVYLGLRDEAPGLSCFGFGVQTGLVRLQANHSGEIVPIQGGSDILPMAGPTAMAVDTMKRFVIGTYRDGTFVGPIDKGVAFNQAFDPGVSLYENDVAWSSNDSFWIAGSGMHDPIDPPDLADVGPRGAALITLKADGTPGASKHYVLASKDAKDVTGLPSSEVAALAVDADGSTYLACATERVGVRTADRVIGDPFSLNGKVRAGGVAQIGKDGAITVLANAEVAPDARGIALDPNGDSVGPRRAEGAAPLPGRRLRGGAERRERAGGRVSARALARRGSGERAALRQGRAGVAERRVDLRRRRRARVARGGAGEGRGPGRIGSGADPGARGGHQRRAREGGGAGRAAGVQALSSGVDRRRRRWALRALGPPSPGSITEPALRPPSCRPSGGSCGNRRPDAGAGGWR
ncbi:MAG: hypothetical protein QM820_16080 [Minicystis sp.]